MSRHSLLLLLALVCAWSGPSGKLHADEVCIGAGGFVQQTITVLHPAVVTRLVTAASTGHQLGDLRVLQATALQDASSYAAVGRLDASLLTTTIDYPAVGDEVRMSTLNFVFGTSASNHLSGLADQLIVSGSGFYPSKDSTIEVGTSLVRPIVGGSGRFAGATGQATSEHLGDGSWRHTLVLRLPAAPAGSRPKPCRKG